MADEPRALLANALEAADAIVAFTQGKSPDEYAADLLLRSAVERQFTIIGEALAQLARIDPALAARISDLPRIVAFRNILVHGYAIVDHEQVWSAVQVRLPALRGELIDLIE